MLSSVSDLKTIPTDQGKGLIVSGTWGFVRHPNYLAELIMMWAMAVLTFEISLFTTHQAISITILLFHRAMRDHQRCNDRYGAAWDKYCSQVRYMIIPGLY